MFEIPFTSQPQETACGPASLKMLLDFYGISVPLETLIEECHVSVDGSTAADLMRVARAHGLDGITAWRTSAEDVLRQDRPGIMLWRGSHFLVYGGLNERDEPVLYNPGRGVYPIDRGTFAKLYSGIMLCNGEPQALPEKPKMAAVENIPKHGYFIYDNTVYQAIQAIPKGSEIKPGVNCAVKSLNDMMGGN